MNKPEQPTERRLLLLYAETPIHAGGSDALGVVDLPIQREAATRLPVVWGQSLKGALRDAARDANWSTGDDMAVFGSAPPRSDGDPKPDDGSGDGRLMQGGVAVGDAQLVLFPTPTLTRTFAWIIGSLQVARLLRKVALLGATPPTPPPPAPGSAVLAGPGWSGRQVIGPFVRTVKQNSSSPALGKFLAKIACPTGGEFDFIRKKLEADVLIVDDSVITEITESGTDVLARVQLETDAKAVANLFYSEYLPAETVLAALLTGPEDLLEKLSGLLDGKPLQLGGDETIGKGLFWCRVVSAARLPAIEVAPAAPEQTPPTSPTPPPQPHRGGPSGARPGPRGGRGRRR